jgi:hypothetical protein
MHELRLEVDWGKEVHITVEQGECEVFGTQLDLGERLRVTGQKLALFSWKGCRLRIEGSPEVMYESEDTPMQQYLNVHETLEGRRRAAASASSEGPRVLVAGAVDVGKSSLCRILLNYAVRNGWAPTAVDLDVGQGSITVPGCIAATPVEAPIDVEEGLPTGVCVCVCVVHAYTWREGVGRGGGLRVCVCFCRRSMLAMAKYIVGLDAGIQFRILTCPWIPMRKWHPSLQSVPPPPPTSLQTPRSSTTLAA